MKVLIRNASKKDLDQISKFCIEMLLYHEKFDIEYKPNKNAKEKYISHLINAINDENQLLITAELNNKIIGFGFAQINKKPPVLNKTFYGFISDVYIDEKYRGKGIFKLLVSKIFTWFKNKNISNVEISIHTQNLLANKIWIKYGFKPYMTKFRLKI